MSRLFVTGTTGFLGEKLGLELLRRGHEVVALVRNPLKVAAELKNNSNYRAVQGDLFSSEVLRKEIGACDAVFHLAGLISYENEDRAQLEKINVGGTQNVLNACPRNIPFVFVSSVVAVGASFREHDQPLNEESHYNLEKLNLGYYETKRKAEKLVQQAHDRGDIQSLIVNPSSIFGPGDVLKGSRSLHLKIAKGKMPFYCRGGVSIVHIEDCLQAIMVGFEKRIFGERFILSGSNLTILQMAQMIAHISERPQTFLPVPQFLLRWLGRKNDRLMSMTLFHWYDHAKATRRLGFQPRTAERAFTDSLQWARKNGYLG